MGLFDWLFGKPKPQLTPLGEFLSKITIESIPTISENQKGDMKVAMAATLSSLNAAHHFWRGLSDMAQKIKMGPEDKVEIPHDIVAFEAAAYANYYFAREFIQSTTRGDDETSDPYRKAMMSAISMTYSMIEGHLPFQTSYEFYIHRVIDYQEPRMDLPIPRPSTEQEILVDFERLVISSMAKGNPATKKDFELGGLSTEVGVKFEVQSYHNLILPAAVKSVRNYHRYLTTGQLPPS